MNKLMVVLSLAALTAVISCSENPGPAGPADEPSVKPLFDDVSNTLDDIIDSEAEVMPLTVSGANGITTLYIQPRNSDGKNGCNIQGGKTPPEKLEVSVASSDNSVATVSPSSHTFTSCVDADHGLTLTITPHDEGSTTITLTQTSNTTGATFVGCAVTSVSCILTTATFTVNVSPPPNTPPQITITGVTGGTSYPKGSEPTPTCDVTDDEDGISSFPASLSVTGPYAIDGIGLVEASCSYTDGGDVTAVESVTYTIVDPSAPSIGYTLAPADPDGNNGWYVSDVSLDWNVLEPESPSSLQKTGCDDQNITADQLEQTYSCSATSAGGSAAQVDVTIKRDATDPTILGSASPAANGAGWNNTDVTVSFTCDDNLSGVASCTLPAILTEGANQSESGTATDNAGNTANTTVSNINIDKTAPVVTVTGVTNITYTLGSVPVAGCTTTDTDGLSGLATSASLNVTGGPVVGSFTATCSGAADNAGNTSSASVTYEVHYAWNGFFQPVENLPLWNSAKAGQSIPVKFSLGGDQGLSIIASGYPKPVAVLCPSSTVVDAIEEYVTITANNGLVYDAVSGQYNYVWKTQKTWAGKCVKFQMDLIDGTRHEALFKFTK